MDLRIGMRQVAQTVLDNDALGAGGHHDQRAGPGGADRVLTGRRRGAGATVGALALGLVLAGVHAAVRTGSASPRPGRWCWGRCSR